jgi:nitrite reductase/ring-hydroxylating ferredoxin subunit
MSDYVTVTRVEDLQPGQVEVFEVGYDFVAVANDGPLVEGDLEDQVIVCPRHGARFDVCTGAVLSLPAVVPLPTYDVRVVDGEVQVRVED